jgi:hypothetical protein
MRTILSSVSVILLACACAFGTTTTLPGTGFDISGNPLAAGSVDPWWTLDHNPVDQTHNAYFIAPGTGNWWPGYIGNTNAAVFSGSGWISTDASSSYNGPAPYTFSMTFSLAGFDLNTVSIAGLWSIADGGALAINGFVVDTLDQSTGPWGTMHSYTINNPSYLLQGTNVISMTVQQSDQYYEAARFEGTLTGTQTAIPEPSNWLLVGSGVLGLAGVLRRKINL